MSKKVYAVRKGLKTGVFQTWDECKQVIEGFSGAEYKGFTSLEDAQAYMNNENILDIHITKDKELASSSNSVISYIDGSYNSEINRYSFGCIIITPKDEIIKESGCGSDPEAILIRNVAGELQGALFVAKWAIAHGYSKLEIRHDYEGIAKWATGEWRAKNKITKLYKDKIEEYKKSLGISFTKVDAHTNNSLNDEADNLAKEALKTGNKAKISKGDTWFTAEGITLEELRTVINLVIEEIDEEIKTSEVDISYGKRFELSIAGKEKIIIQHYIDKNSLQIQGKPQQLFSVVVAFISELVEIEKIPEFFNSFFKLEINKENVKTEFKSCLPNAFGKLPEKLDRVLHQAVYNLNIFGEVFDATFLVEPAIRALEGHLKVILINCGISLRENSDDKRDKFYMFKKDGQKYRLEDNHTKDISEKLCEYISKCYTYFHNNRHQLCHWDNPTEQTDTTRLINNTNDAHTIIKNTLALIDEYYIIK